jgi:hypothetical protein
VGEPPLDTMLESLLTAPGAVVRYVLGLITI